MVFIFYFVEAYVEEVLIVRFLYLVFLRVEEFRLRVMFKLIVK